MVNEFPAEALKTLKGFKPEKGKYYTAMVIVGGFTVDSIRLDNEMLGLRCSKGDFP